MHESRSRQIQSTDIMYEVRTLLVDFAHNIFERNLHLYVEDEAVSWLSVLLLKPCENLEVFWLSSMQ